MLWSAVWALSTVAFLIVAAAMLRRVRTGPKGLGAVSAHWVAQQYTNSDEGRI